jgi:uncharacterized protein (TIGR03086 family)
VDGLELDEVLGGVGEWLDGAGVRPARETLARAVRVSLRELARRAPGGAVEVRVPPFAVVQCGAGPRHTRGTPPNVVETDPHTWLALATARQSWTEALAAGRVSASGARADLSRWLPLVRPQSGSSTMGDMTLGWFELAMGEFDRRVRSVAPDQWGEVTPCSEWDVRALVNHLVTEQLWAPLLLDGATIEDVGDRFEGDQLGADPVAAWASAAAAAREAFAAPGALRRSVELSHGRRPAQGYCQEMTLDLTVHTWDLARAIKADEQLDEGLVREVLAFIEPQIEQLAGTGLFAPPIEVDAGADAQTRLMALVGRRT